MKLLTQKEAIDMLAKTPYPRVGGDLRYIQRFMFKLSDLSKSRGYRIFNWTDYMLQDKFKYFAAEYVISTIEEQSKEAIKKKNETVNKPHMS